MKSNLILNSLEKNRSRSETCLNLDLPIVTTIDYKARIEEFYQKMISENRLDSSRVIEFCSPLYLSDELILLDVINYTYFPHGHTSHLVIEKQSSGEFLLLATF